MFDHCIIHIGTEKTGTSSIQAMLQVNAKPWSKTGVLIPSEFGSGNNRQFVNYAIDDAHFGDGRRQIGVTTPEELSRFRTGTEKQLRELAEKASHHTLVISSEHCHSQLTHEPAVARLHHLLEPYCRSFSIVCFLRPQHEVALSLYSTALRVGHAEFPLIPQKDERDRYYNYDLLLDRWANVFGQENVRPLIYSAKDVVADFVRLAGLPPPVHSAPKVNTSLGGRTQAFLREMNRVLPRQARGNLADLAADDATLPPARPARADAERFLAAFQESNSAVRRRWFPNKSALFSSDFSRYPENAVLPEISLADAFQAFADVWSQKQEQVARLQKELRDARANS